MKTIDSLKNNKFRILILLLIFIVLAFSILNVFWFKHINILKSILYNEKLVEIMNTPSTAPENFIINGVEYNGYSYSRYSFFTDNGWEYHMIRDFDYNEAGIGKYSYNIAIPPYLHFAKGISIMAESDEYVLTMGISIRDWTYYMSIDEVLSSNQGHTIISGIGVLYITKDGQVLNDQPQYEGNKTDEYNNVLAAYTRYNEQILDMVVTVNEIFVDTLK